MDPITNIADLRERAEKRMPDMVFDYLEGGGYEEETLERNRSDLLKLAFRPRVLNDVSERNLAVDMVGTWSSMPLGLAPVGACGIFYRDGEIHAAKAAEAGGIPFCLSTLSICSIEDVAGALQKPFWFQLYLMKDRGVGTALIQRARDAGCSALVVSMDVHVRSSRYGEVKHGLTAPPKVSATNILDAMFHPSWLFPMMLSRRRTFGNLAPLVKKANNVFGATEWLEDQWDPTLGVKDIEWVKKQWPGKLIIKGLLHPDDARLAVDAGADAVVISNHGGRQVDGAISTVAAIPSVVDAVGDRAQVLVDSGIRSGIDILKMLGNGAHGCLVGRAFCYGLGALGRRGVKKAIEILRRELDETMGLCGITDVRNLPEGLLARDQSLHVEPSSNFFLR